MNVEVSYMESKIRCFSLGLRDFRAGVVCMYQKFILNPLKRPVFLFLIFNSSKLHKNIYTILLVTFNSITFNYYFRRSVSHMNKGSQNLKGE